MKQDINTTSVADKYLNNGRYDPFKSEERKHEIQSQLKPRSKSLEEIEAPAYKAAVTVVNKVIRRGDSNIQELKEITMDIDSTFVKRQENKWYAGSYNYARKRIPVKN